MAATLFDLSPYHVELESDPTRPTAAECLRLITEAETAGDTAWLQSFQHYLFFNCELYAEADYQTLFERYSQAAEKLVSDRAEEIQTDKSKLKPTGNPYKYYLS